MHAMRRQERQIEEEDILKILKENEYGVLSTMGADGYPYGVPLNYFYAKGRIYFHCATVGHKLENIAYNNKASFCVVGKTQVLPAQFSTKYESVIAFGEIKEVSPEEKEIKMQELVERFAPDFREKGAQYIKAASERVRMFYLEIKQMTGKARR